MYVNYPLILGRLTTTSFRAFKVENEQESGYSGLMNLIEISEVEATSFLRMVDDFRKNDPLTFSSIYKRQRPWDKQEFESFLLELKTKKQSYISSEGQVSISRYALVNEKNEICANGILRFPLSSRSLKEGGNVGYDVPPSMRGKGYSLFFLLEIVKKARLEGLEKILLTCNSDNLPSVRTIEKAGGVLENVIESSESNNLGKRVSRYWIKT